MPIYKEVIAMAKCGGSKGGSKSKGSKGGKKSGSKPKTR